MALAIELKAAQERLGKALQDAKAAAPPAGAPPTAEQLEKFTKATEAAKVIGVEVQTLRSQLDIERMQSLADGPLQEIQEQPAPAPGARPAAVLQPEDIQRAQAHRGPQRLSDSEYRERFGGVSREAHNAGFRAFLRSRATQNAGQRAVDAMRQVMGTAGPAEQHLHSLVDDGLGGFTAGDDWRSEIIRALPGYAVVRASGARVITTGKAGVTYPVLNRATSNTKQYSSDLTQGSSNWKAEGATFGGTARTPQSKPTFGSEYIPVHIWQPDPIELTQELLDDTDVPLENILRDLVAETLGQDLDFSFLRGDGVNNPEGLLNSGAAAVTIGSAAQYATPATGVNGFSYKGVTDIYTGLASQYRQSAVWYLNSDTLGRLIWLGTGATGGDQHPLFPVNGTPGTLFNRPMYFTEFLDNGNTQNNVPLIFGAPHYYVIAERRQLGIVRLVERYAPNVGLQPTARIGGQLVLKEAFRLGTTGA